MALDALWWAPALPFRELCGLLRQLNGLVAKSSMGRVMADFDCLPGAAMLPLTTMNSYKAQNENLW